MYAIDTQALHAAFSSGRWLEHGKPVTFSVVEAGVLQLTSGRVVAADPLVDPDAPAFDLQVPVGAYPVALAIARMENGDERIAYARLSFGDGAVRAWRMALLDGQSTAALGADEFFGYGVDAGTGCFMDRDAAERLARRFDEDEAASEALIEAMEANCRSTRSWATYRPSETHAANVVCFSSGWGDGSYPSFFGLDEAGRPVALVTDFCVVGAPAAAESAPAPAPKRPWWKRFRTWF